MYESFLEFASLILAKFSVPLLLESIFNEKEVLVNVLISIAL